MAVTGLQIAVAIGIGQVVGGILAHRLRLPAPLLLVAIGIGLGFVPAFSGTELPPEVVLAVFLPPLLHWEAVQLSVREAQRNARAIILLAVPLVLVTATAVAGAGRAIGLPLAAAVALGAIVAPTDAAAVDQVVTTLPRSAMTTLRGESLINDGTALTIYAVALAALGSGARIDLGQGALVFAWASVGGVLIGMAACLVASGAHRLVRSNPLLENTVSVLTPYLAFLPADGLHVSGVLSVVTCGLLLQRRHFAITSVTARAQARGFWQVGTSLISGALFVLVGLQAKGILTALGDELLAVIGFGLVVAVIITAVRLLWVNTVPYVLRLIDRPRGRARPRTGFRQRLIASWAGIRGAVSLAAALALPPFPERPRILAVTLIVILFTQTVQGVSMPAVVRFARVLADHGEDEEEKLARRVLAKISETAAEVLIAELHVPPDAADRLRRLVADRGNLLRGELVTELAGDLERALLGKQREALYALRREGRFDDLVLSRLQDLLDIEELRLAYIEDDSDPELR